MPKILDYPSATFEKCIELANAIESLGGNCSKDIAGEKMGLTGTSGGFGQIVSSAVKFKLIRYEKGKLSITETFKSIKQAYSENERLVIERDAFLTPKVFRSLFEKLKGKEIPTEILPKMLIREFGVESEDASKVSKYFIKGLTEIKLIAGNIIIDDSVSNVEIEEGKDNEEPETINLPTKAFDNGLNGFEEALIIQPEKYVVHFIGPGLNSKLEIQDSEDFLIVEATLKKIKKKYSSNEIE